MPPDVPALPPSLLPLASEDWPEFFQLPVLMLMLITLLNDGTLISIGYDNVKSSPRPGTRTALGWAAHCRPLVSCRCLQPCLLPFSLTAARSSRSPLRRVLPLAPPAEKWNLRVLFLISTVLGMISMGSSLLLVHLVLDSPNSGSLFQKWGLPVPVSPRGGHVAGGFCGGGGGGVFKKKKKMNEFRRPVPEAVGGDRPKWRKNPN